MRKEWFFTRLCGAQIAVYAEDGKIAEATFERGNNAELTGNIYKGKVCILVPGMQAAFISCGLERNCYLPLCECAPQFTAYDGEGNAVHTPDLKEGDEILVQIVKPPRGNKGAKVTCDLSFVGKTLIYLPQTDFLGISRKIVAEDTRERLLKDVDKLREKGEGFIVRTAAEEAEKRALKIESEYLKRVWRSVEKTAQKAAVGDVVYRECDLPIKVMRDSLGGGVTHIYVGDKPTYDKVAQLARLRSDLGERKISLYQGKREMLREFGLAEQLLSLAERTVPLENGAYLVIDKTEAMTVIDVNTGKFIGESDLESTVFETNLLAAREIARQVRLRNIGGLVAVDFIDMTDEEHRRTVDATLAETLAADRTKSRVSPMGDMCVTLFTRKRTNNDAADFFLQPCRHCAGLGTLLSDIVLSIVVRGDINDCFANGYTSVLVECNREFAKNVLFKRYLSEEMRGAWSDKRVYLIPHDDWDYQKYTVRGDNAPVLSLPDCAQLLY